MGPQHSYSSFQTSKKRRHYSRFIAKTLDQQSPANLKTRALLLTGIISISLKA